MSTNSEVLHEAVEVYVENLRPGLHSQGYNMGEEASREKFKRELASECLRLTTSALSSPPTTASP